MALDEPSAQLHAELRAAIQSALASRRPLIHHLNADTSWLLQIPRPDSAVKHGGRFYYNILIDPWLQGGQSDVASWFSQQHHAIPSAVGSIAEVEELAREIEVLAAGLRLGYARKTNAAVDAEDGTLLSFIDAVTISHEFTDHCHKETLLRIDSNVPVFTTPEAAKVIKSWQHFRTVIIVQDFGSLGDTDWRSTSLSPLPSWIGISRLLQRIDVLNYHSALMITFNNQHPSSVSKLDRPLSGASHRHKPIEPDEDEEVGEAVIYTPHGINSGDLELVPGASPPICPLAFLHGLHNVRIGTVSGRTALQLNLGAMNGLKAQRVLKAKYWMGTHDEVKKGGGLVAWFLQRKVLTLKYALDLEQQTRQAGGVSGEMERILDSFEDTRWIELGNGESRLLA